MLKRKIWWLSVIVVMVAFLNVVDCFGPSEQIRTQHVMRPIVLIQGSASTRSSDQGIHGNRNTMVSYEDEHQNVIEQDTLQGHPSEVKVAVPKGYEPAVGQPTTVAFSGGDNIVHVLVQSTKLPAKSRSKSAGKIMELSTFSKSVHSIGHHSEESGKSSNNVKVGANGQVVNSNEPANSGTADAIRRAQLGLCSPGAVKNQAQGATITQFLIMSRIPAMKKLADVTSTGWLLILMACLAIGAIMERHHVLNPTGQNKK